MLSDITQPTLLLPAATLFESRAARFRHLAKHHSLAPWLALLGALCDLQQKEISALPRIPLQPAADTPLLAIHQPELLTAARKAYRNLAGNAAASFSLDATQAAILAAPLSDTDLDIRLQAALQYAQDMTPIANWDVTSLLAAAAVQIAWQHATRQLGLPVESDPAVAPEACPCCGSLPVGSIIMAGDGKAGVRYLECSLCATRWHAVRAHCALCPSDKGIRYLSLEGQDKVVQAEVCDDCHGYQKVFLQTGDIRVDPVADDLATLALDVLVGEQGYGRGVPNLLMNDGTPVS